MTIMFKLLDDGAFVAGDTVTRRTAYAYPTSEHATIARRLPERVAAEMMASAHRFSPSPHIAADYDARNWRRLTTIDGNPYRPTIYAQWVESWLDDWHRWGPASATIWDRHA